jgi:hypothetical protein
MSTRYSVIIAAYETALAGRDPETVDILELLPAIVDAVPDTNDEEIVDALRWSADGHMREAEELRRRVPDKFGNSVSAALRSSKPN